MEIEYLEIRRDRTENGLQVFSFHILYIVGDEFTYFTEMLVMYTSVRPPFCMFKQPW